MNEFVKELILKMNNKGYEAYLVGGAVRDFLLNCVPNDYDIATSATLNEILTVLSEYKILGVIKSHNTVIIHHNHIPYEITSFKGNNIIDDLKHRDYTINAIAMDVNEDIIDPLNGRIDLENHIIKMCDKDSFKDVSNRILRGIRMSQYYDFNVDDNTYIQMKNHLSFLLETHPNNIRLEFEKILTGPNPSYFIRKYIDIFCAIIPQLKPMIGLEQLNKYHIYDVFEHTMHVLDATKPNVVCRLVGLLHDIGKPNKMFVDDNGVGHFWNHWDESAKLAKPILEQLMFDSKTINTVLKLCKWHDYQLEPNKKNLKRFILKYGTEHIEELIDIKKADIIGQNPEYINRLKVMDEIHQILDDLITNDVVTIKGLAINGKDLIELGIPKSKIKELLNELLNLVVTDEIKNDKNELLKHVKKVVSVDVT